MKNTTPIAKIMTRKPMTVQTNDSLDTVRHIFEDKGFHHLPVMENGKLVGIVSYTDYLKVVRNIYNHPQEHRANEQLLQAVCVHEVMSKHLVFLAPMDTVEDAIRVFQTHRFHAIPVVEGDRNLVGIVSTHDLIKILEQVLAPNIDYANV